MIDEKDVTIIIPHLGASKEQEYAFNQCDQSLKETVPDIRTIVVKNGSNPCFGMHEDSHGDIIIFEQGQCKAVNAAVAMSGTPWVLVTNDDMIYPPGWFEKLTTHEIDREILCLSPKLIEPRAGAPTFEVQFFGGAGGDFNKQAWVEFAKNYEGRGVRTGFNLPFLIKRELWDTIGGYDINYDPWGSNGDSDLEYKIRLAGVQPYQNTNSIVYHYSQTSGSFSPENRSYWDKNWHYFISKWGFPRADSPMIWEANFELPEDKLKYQPFWKDFYKKNA